MEAEGLQLEAVGQSIRTTYYPESPIVIIGKLMATDIVLNNPDRIPTIWKNGGNAGNIHIEIAMREPVLGRDYLLMSAKNLDHMHMLNLVSIDCQTYPMLVKTNINNNTSNLLAFITDMEQFFVDFFRDLRIYRSYSSWQNLQANDQEIFYEHTGVNIKPLNDLEWGCFTSTLKFLADTTGNHELFGPQSKVKGRICLQLSLGILLGLMKWSILGDDVLENCLHEIKIVNSQYDYKDFWQRAVDQFEDLSFYKIILRTIR
jgi:hypothetical protein